MPAQKGGVTKEDLKNFKEEIVHQFHVISEDVISQVKLVAEGVVTVNEKLERTRQELKEEIDNKTQPIARAVLELSGKVVALDGKVVSLDDRVVALDGKVVSLDDRVVALDGKVVSLDDRVVALDGKVAALDGKVTALDGKVTVLDRKVDRIHQELKTEIQETRQEILAAVKFSYAELDRRLTTLEKEFFELKLRVEKIESRSTA
jgi:chromosome segregation ATPase